MVTCPRRTKNSVRVRIHEPGEYHPLHFHDFVPIPFDVGTVSYPFDQAVGTDQDSRIPC